MKKISILLITILFVSCTFKIKADEHEGFTDNTFQTIPVPTFCGATVQVLYQIMNTFRMRFVMSGEVRSGGLSDGTMIGATSFWYNEKTNKGIYAMTMQDTGLTCMLAYGINMKFEEDMMLDIINEEMK